MIRILRLVAACLAALAVGEARAGTPVFLNKSVFDWQGELNAKEPAARRSAAFALGRMGDSARGAVPDLVTRLGSDPDAGVRDMAASAIGDIARSLKGAAGSEWEAAGGALNESLKSDQSPRVRRSAAYALGCFGPAAAGAAGTLEKALTDDNAGVRQNAAWALGQMGEQAGPAVGALCRCLRDGDALVRRDAAGALGSTGKAGSAAGEPLIALVKSEKDEVVKKTALDALAHIAGPEHAEAAAGLEPLLAERDPEIKLSAAIVMARIGGDRAVRALPVLRQALKGPDMQIRELVAASLSELGPRAEPAMRDLAEALNDDSNPTTVRRNAALAIAHIGPAAGPVVPEVVKALRSDRPLEVRQFTAEALAQIRYPANKEAVGNILKAIEEDRDPLVRQKCVWALFGMADPEPFRECGADKVLTRVLDASGFETALLRYDAARKLAQVLGPESPEKTADVLLDMYNNKTLRVYNRTDARVEGAGTEATAGRARVQANLGGDARYMAVQAMGWLGSKAKKNAAIMEAIRESARSKDERLKKTADEALKNIERLGG